MGAYLSREEGVSFRRRQMVMVVAGQTEASQEVGSLRLTVAYFGEQEDLLGGTRSQFKYRVRSGSRVYSGIDLFGGTGVEVTATGMLATLSGFLAGAADRYRVAMSPPDDEYPEWLYEQAYANDDELAMLSLEAEESTGATSAAEAGRWHSIVFLQGEDADHVVDLIEREGPAAGVDHLSQWDFGDETISAAKMDGHVYDSPPTDAWSREHRQGDYHLSWSPPLGHVSLSRFVRPEPSVPTASALPRAASMVDRRGALGSSAPTVASGIGPHDRAAVKKASIRGTGL